MSFYTLFAFFKHILLFFIIYLPGNPGIKLRRYFYQKKLAECGKNLIVHPGVVIENPSSISMGDNVTIDAYTIIKSGGSFKVEVAKGSLGHGKLKMGCNIHIGSFCLIAYHSGVEIRDKCVIGSGTQLFSMSNSLVVVILQMKGIL